MIGNNAIERRKSELIEDDEVGTNVLIDKSLYGNVGHGGVKLRCQMLDRRKNNAVAAQTGFDTDRRRKMALPNARWADEQSRFVFGDEVTAGKCFDLLDVDRGLKRKVKLFERLRNRKARRSQSLIQPFVVARTQLVVDECL